MSHPKRAKRNLLPGKPAPASKDDLAALRREMRALNEAVAMATALVPPSIPPHLVEAALNAFAAETSGSSPLSSNPDISPVQKRLGPDHATTYSFDPELGAYSTPQKAAAAGREWVYVHHNTVKAGIEAVLRVLWEAEQKELER